MFGLGVPEIIVIGIIILLIFGAKRLPIIGESLGKTVKEIRKTKKEISGIKKSDAKKEVGESNESEGQSLETDIVDTVQKKVTDKYVKLEFEIKRLRGNHGRLLAYCCIVFIVSGGVKNDFIKLCTV